MEHRWGHRVTTDLTVRLLGTPACIGWGRLLDVSVSGGYIETQLVVRPLTLLRIALPLDDEGMMESRTVEAIVIRCEPGGCGVEWMSPSDTAIARLVRGAAVRDAADPPRQVGHRHYPSA